MMVKIHPVTEYTPDLDDLLRRSSVAEVTDGKSILSKFIETSVRTYVGVIDDQQVCIYGVIKPTILSDRAYLWLLTTDSVEEFKFTFIRHSQLCVSRLLDTYPLVCGETHVNDAKAKRWLRWLGAVYEKYPVGDRLSFKITKETFGQRKWTQ